MNLIRDERDVYHSMDYFHFEVQKLQTFWKNCQCYKFAHLAHLLFLPLSAHSFDKNFDVHPRDICRNYLAQITLALNKSSSFLVLHYLHQYEVPEYVCLSPGTIEQWRDAYVCSICDNCHRIHQYRPFLYRHRSFW